MVRLSNVKPSHFILPSICRCSRLTCIELDDITLTDTVTLPPQLQTVKLDNVCPAQFILPSLPRCLNITSLYITLYGDCEMLAGVLPRLQHLQYIHYNGALCSSFDIVGIFCVAANHAAVVSALQHHTKLTHIELENIDLGDDGTLLVAPHMTQLQKIELKQCKDVRQEMCSVCRESPHCTAQTTCYTGGQIH